MDQQATTHLIVTDLDLLSTVWIEPKYASVNVLRTMKSQQIRTHLLRRECHRRMLQRATTHPIVIDLDLQTMLCMRKRLQSVTSHPIIRDPDLRPAWWMSSKDASVSDHPSNHNIFTCILCHGCHRNIHQPATSSPIATDQPHQLHCGCPR